VIFEWHFRKNENTKTSTWKIDRPNFIKIRERRIVGKDHRFAADRRFGFRFVFAGAKRDAQISDEPNN